jgi:tetratricopeptide (TPR) repeat protein
MQKALEVDPNNGFAHERMAWSLLWFEWNFKGAEKEYLETKRIYPNYTWTDYLLANGNFEEAVRDAEPGIEFDPTSPTTWSGKILSQFFAGQYDNAIRTINDAKNDTTIRGRSLVILESCRVLMYMERYQEAIKEMEKMRAEYPEIESPRLLAIGSISYLHTGKLDKSNKILEALKDKSAINAGGSPSFYIAMIYSQMGEINEAFKWLEKSYQDREVEMYWLKVEPPFEPIRSDPRYQEMLDKVGFPE